MKLRFPLAALALVLLTAAPAHAGELTARQVPDGCDYDSSQPPLAMACDPGGRARHIALRLSASPLVDHSAREQATLPSSEPLQPGETLALDWSHPSSSGVLVVTAWAPADAHTVVFRLPSRPAHVTVTMDAGGVLTLDAPPAVHATLPSPGPPPPIAWSPRTPRAAAVRLLSTVDRMERSITALRTLCAALAPGVREYLGFGYGREAEQPCLTGVALSVFGDENVADVRSTKHHGFSLQVRGNRAVLTTRLVHRYHPDDNFDRAKLVVTARVLLVRDRQGIWRVGTLEPLLPLVAVFHPHAFSDKLLGRQYRHLVHEGRADARRLAALERREQDATAPSAPAPPCAAPLLGDPVADVTLNGDPDARARHQDALGGVDVSAAGATRQGCIAVRMAGPLPAAFDLDVYPDGGDSLQVHVLGTRVLVTEGEEYDEIKLVTGVKAYVGPNTLVLQLPRALAASLTLTTDKDPEGSSYQDSIKLEPSS